MQDKSTLKIRAYTIIKQKIVSCQLEPGSPVSEKELMQEIGVSRTPVREALGLLESEKLVKVFPKRGVFVTDITEKEILDIYTMRICLESTAVRLAVPYLDEKDDIERFHALYSSAEYSATFEEHLAIDREFHLGIARASRNEYMYETIAN
ncbi:MAG: GntR family transcriptional regulator, partial [Planctomycetes bacterium]|nr:GntR family transcriptional regulator [Planctomycetota bacterium]